MLRSQSQTDSNVLLGDLFDSVKQFIFPNLLPEYQGLFNQTARAILETTPIDLDALFDFIERFVFPNIAPERREMFADEIVRIISSRILGNLKSCINLLYSSVFNILPAESKEIVAIRMIRSIFQVGSYILDVSLDFATTVFYHLLPEYQGTFVVQITEFFLPNILENSKKFFLFISRINFAHLSEIQKETVYIRVLEAILKTRPNDLDTIHYFMGSPIFHWLPYQHRGTLNARLINIILPEISGNLEACSNFIKSHLFLTFLPDEDKKIFAIRMINNILETKAYDLNTLSHFAELVFPFLPHENRRIFADQIIETILPRILGNLEICTLTLDSSIFLSLTPQRREIIAIQMAKSVLQARPDDVIAFLNTNKSNFIVFTSAEQRQKFAVQAIEVILPRALGNLAACINLIKSSFFNYFISDSDKEIIAIEMNESILRFRSKPDDIDAILDFVGCVFLCLSSERQEKFPDQMIETILPWTLGNLKLCNNLMKSFFFRIIMSNKSKEIIAIRMIRGILKAKPDDLDALLDLIEHNIFTSSSFLNREIFANQIVETILMEALGNLELFNNLIKSFFFRAVSNRDKKNFVIRIVESILKARSNNLNAILVSIDFIERNVFTVVPFDWEVFTDQITETILPAGTLGNLELCTRMLDSSVFLSLPAQFKEIIAIQMARSILQARPGDLKTFIDLTERYFILAIPAEQKVKFATQAIEIISPKILGDLDACSSLINSTVFHNLPFLYKRKFVINAIKSVLESKTENPNAFVGFMEHAVLLSNEIRRPKIARPAYPSVHRALVRKVNEIQEPSLAHEAIELFLPRILGNLSACTDLLESTIFRELLTPLDKAIFISIMILNIQEEKSLHLREFFNSIEKFAFPVSDPYQKLKFALSISEIILKERPDDLNILLDFTERLVFPRPSSEIILKKRPSNLSILLYFTERLAFPLISSEYQGEFIAETILQVKLNDLNIFLDLTKGIVFPRLSLECQEKFVTEIVLKSTLDKLNAILNFVERSAVPLILSEHQGTVIVKAMDAVLSKISEYFYEYTRYTGYDAQFLSCIRFMEHNAQSLSQAQQEIYAEQIFNIISEETPTPCNSKMLLIFEESPIFNWLTVKHKARFEEIKLNDLNKCVRLVESDYFKSSSYREKVQILIQILNNHNSSFFDFSSISVLCSLQAPIADLPNLKTMKICEVAKELTSNPSPDTPETRTLSQTLLESYRSVFDNYDLTLTQFQQEKFMEPSLRSLPGNPETLILSSRIKDFEQKKRESRGKSKTS
ncbi:MAG: hypothetical protein LBJ93_02910, partial [Clostridiales bacterium]|nr:hypothetical protein [Clostridiales bacterium]